MDIRSTGGQPVTDTEDQHHDLLEGDRASLSDVEIVQVAELREGFLPRTGAVDLEHARALARSAACPPIVVHRSSMRVIDGVHRLWAAGIRGEKVIGVRFFEGGAQDAFLLAVRENTMDGMPLSQGDRVAAAGRLVASHGHWSDRAIAEVVGLSSQTVGEIRRANAEQAPRVDARLGRDGRIRPVNSAEGRLSAARLIADMPGASLRRIAELAGISPGTVRDVRARLSRGESPVPESVRAKGTVPGPRTETQLSKTAGSDPSPQEESAPLPDPPPAVLPAPGPSVEVKYADALNALVKDPSLKYVEDGRILLRLLVANALPPSRWEDMVGAVPERSAELVGVVARVNASAWMRFAEIVEQHA